MAISRRKFKGCPHCGYDHVTKIDDESKTFNCPMTGKTWAVAAAFATAKIAVNYGDFDMKIPAEREAFHSAKLDFKA